MANSHAGLAPTTGHAQAPAQSAVGASVPFTLASRRMIRSVLGTQVFNLQAGVPTIITPQQVPATGYLSYMNMEVTITTTGGATPTFTADGPFNVFQNINFRTAAGQDIIQPVNGFQAYLLAKYGVQQYMAPYSDARMGRQFAVSGGNAHFFLPIPLEINSASALGAVPALAANRNFQLAMTLAPVSAIMSGAPTSVQVTITTTAYYWSQPPVSTQSGTSQAGGPSGLGTINRWGASNWPLTPGSKKLALTSSVGNVLRTLIFTLRNSAGVRIDGSATGAGFPPLVNFYLDNEILYQWSANEWQDLLSRVYQMPNALDTAQGLDTGVYVIPFHSLAGGTPGDTAQCNSQLLPTLDASQLEIEGLWGSGASTLELLTNDVIPVSAQTLYQNVPN